MDRELRILNHNKRNVAKTVSRKPSPSEGFNGDIYMGNTPDGIIMYAKVKNKWHGFKPRTAKDSLPTFRGSIHLKNFFINKNAVYKGWIKLYGYTHHPHDHWENVFQSSWNIGQANGWRDMQDLPYLLPEDCTIKFIHSVASQGSNIVPGTTSKLYIFSLESGTATWDPDVDAMHEDNILESPTLVDTAIATIEESHTLFKYELNNEKVYPKGSHIAFYILNANEGWGDSPGFLRQHFILQFEPQEQNI